MRKVKILIVDDHEMIRLGIRSYFESDEKYEIVDEASNGEEALQKVENQRIDMVIMDINMDKMDGITCTQELTKRHPSARVLALTMLSENLHIKQMMNAGAAGYLLKNSGEAELKKAIDIISEGGTYFSEEVTTIIMENLAKRKANAPKRSRFSVEAPLTSREKEVLELVVKEYSNQEIANALFISVRTVDAHKRNLIEKTGAKNIAGLVMFAVNNQLFEDI